MTFFLLGPDFRSFPRIPSFLSFSPFFISGRRIVHSSFDLSRCGMFADFFLFCRVAQERHDLILARRTFPVRTGFLFALGDHERERFRFVCVFYNMNLTCHFINNDIPTQHGDPYSLHAKVRQPLSYKPISGLFPLFFANC